MANGRQLNSQPTNWTIDYGQDRRGEFWGNALANTGGVLGNAIAKYAKDSREKAEREAKEKQAMDYLKGAMNVDDEKAKGIVKGIGLDNFIQFQQLDQQKREADTRTALLAHRAQVAEAKAAQSAAEKGAVLDSLKTALLRRPPQSGPMSVIPAGGVSGELEETPGVINARRFLLESTRRNVDPKTSLDLAEGLGRLNRAAREGQPFVPTSGAFEDGRKYYRTSPNSVQVDAREPREKLLEVGQTEKYALPGTDRTITRQYVGGGKWQDTKTRLPVMLTETHPLTGAVSIRPNPVVWGTDLEPARATETASSSATPAAPAAPATPAAPAGVVRPRPRTQAEYDALPKGTEYIDQDGKVRRKR